MTAGRRPAPDGPAAAGVVLERVWLAVAGAEPARAGPDRPDGKTRGTAVPRPGRAGPANRACSGWCRAWSCRQPAKSAWTAGTRPPAGRPAWPGYRSTRPCWPARSWTTWRSAGRALARRRPAPPWTPPSSGRGWPACHMGLRTRLSGLDEPLSLGERRRLAVARVLAGPQVGLWLLDEPTAGLDPGTAARLLGELSDVIGAATALIATHDPAAQALGQRVAELDHGGAASPATRRAPGRWREPRRACGAAPPSGRDASPARWRASGTGRVLALGGGGGGAGAARRACSVSAASCARSASWPPGDGCCCRRRCGRRS